MLRHFILFQPIPHFLHFPTPIRPQTNRDTYKRAVHQRGGQANPETVEACVALECQPDAEWDTNHVISTEVQGK